MSNFNQVAAALRNAASNRNAAASYVGNPAAAWQAMGGQLPAGVTPAQFNQRVGASELHKTIAATANGQMSTMDWSDCNECRAVAMYFLCAIGVVAAGGALVITGGTIGAIAGFFGFTEAATSAAAGIAGAAVAGTFAQSICRSMGRCD
jgi:hypothetical protein